MGFRSSLRALVACSGLAVASRADADVDLWPLLELDEDTTTVMYPFYVHEGDFLMVFPAYYRTDEAHEHHVLWPLLKVRDGRVTRVAPVWFSDDSDEFWIFPLAYHGHDSTFVLVPPAYFRGDEFQMVLPLWVRARHPDDDWLVVGPRLWGRHRTADFDHVFAGLLFDRVTHSNGDWETALAPLVWTWGGADRSGVVLAPFLRKSHTPTSDSVALYPFFATKSAAEPGEPRTEELSILWPMYKRKVSIAADGEVTHRHRRFLAFADERTPDHRQLSLFGFVVRETTN